MSIGIAFPTPGGGTGKSGNEIRNGHFPKIRPLGLLYCNTPADLLMVDLFEYVLNPMLLLPTPGPSFWLSAQNLQFSQNHGELDNMKIDTVILSKFDSICELQPEFRP